MAVSVRMEPILEKELELAAKRKGMTKSQFIIEAVQRALGQRDPGTLYHQVMEEAATYSITPVADEDLPPHKQAVKEILRAKYAQEQDDYDAYLQQKDQQKNVADGGGV